MIDSGFDELRAARALAPERFAELAGARQRRALLPVDSRLLIVAADHPARGTLGVGGNPAAMSNRYELLNRLRIALANPGVDGVLATPDIVEDLLFLGALENKIVAGSVNRGGLSNSVFEMDDRQTAYSPAAIHRDRLDFAKLLVRVDRQDPATVRTLELAAQSVSESAALRLPIMLEPFLSSRIAGKVVNELTAEAVISAVAIASGLGSSSAYTWLKLPVVDGMERVMEATTLPTLLLGGDPRGHNETLFSNWESALRLPGVRGLVAGRRLLYPPDGDVEGAVAEAVSLVHAGESAS